MPDYLNSIFCMLVKGLASLYNSPLKDGGKGGSWRNLIGVLKGGEVDMKGLRGHLSRKFEGVQPLQNIYLPPSLPRRGGHKG